MATRRYLPISRNDDGFFLPPLFPSFRKTRAAWAQRPPHPPQNFRCFLSPLCPSFLPVSISWGKINRQSGNLEEGEIFAAFAGWLTGGRAGSVSLMRHFEVMGGDISHGRLCWRPATVIIAAAKLMTRMSYVATAADRSERSGAGQSTHDRFGAFPDN